MTPIGATILITLTWIVFVIFGKATLDNWQLNRHRRIRHGLELVGVIFLAIIHAGLCGVRRADDYALTMLIFQASSFWLLFDGLLSLMRGKPWFYIGKLALTDRFFRKIGMSFYPWSKLVALIFTIYGVVNIFNYWS